MMSTWWTLQCHNAYGHVCATLVFVRAKADVSRPAKNGAPSDQLSKIR